MSLALTQSLTAVAPNISSSFAAQGGTAPYTYSVKPNGAGGTINASTGIYTAPVAVPTTAQTQFDTILVQDSAGAVAQASIMVGDALLLVCDILQNQLGLPLGRVYLWDQKIMQPTDAGLYVAVSVLSCKAFGNDNTHSSVSGGLNSGQSINMASTIQIDIMSRDNSARLRKEEVLMALNSDYAESQQNANGFFIGKLPPGAQFNNISSPDGAAIPYRFVISMVIQYFVTKTQAVPYLSQFAPVDVNYSQS